MKIKNIFWSKWKVAKSGWPYHEGYGTYRKNIITGNRVILDTGLSLEGAKEAARELNINH